MKALNLKEVPMTRTKSSKYSNFMYGTVLFLGFLLMWGCSKNVAPPEVEEPPAPVVEAIPEPEPEAAPEETALEDGFGIVEDGTIQEGGFVDVEPEPVEEIAEVIPEPIFEEPMVEEPVFEEPVVEEPVIEEVYEEPLMEMQQEVFVAPPAEEEPVQEARVLPFEDEKRKSVV